jgi:predicted transglutaminase-like cysteine proteinase
MEKRLQAVLDEAHAQHSYVIDDDQYRRPEYWEAGLVGDCEDFALWCRERLAAQGVESDLVYCKLENGKNHLVLSVDGWILDNRHVWVIRRDDLRYDWISLGKPDGTWLMITG